MRMCSAVGIYCFYDHMHPTFLLNKPHFIFFVIFLVQIHILNKFSYLFLSVIIFIF